jgi:glycosyltransferase involved in cell wall biosynthesis
MRTADGSLGGRSPAEPRAARIALVYVTGTYPLLTTTFIDREIDLLRRLGADIQVVSARRPPSATRLSDAMAVRERDTMYLLPPRTTRLLAAHVHFAIRRPWTFVATLASLVAGDHPDLRSRIKTVLHFGEGVYAAYLIRDRAFEELHAHFADRAATIALVASRLLGVPFSLSIHAGADVFVDPVLLGEKLRAARRVVTCTDHNRRHLASLTGVPADSIATVLHGLDLSEFPADARRDEPDPPLILAVGQLAERKGFSTLVRACGELVARGYRFRCEIVGRGPERDALARLIRQEALDDRVVLVGALPHEEVIERYRRATVFALPCSRTAAGDVDGIPNVVAEAMASGLPVVCTDLPAIRELVTDRIDGLLVPPGEPSRVADAIAELVDCPTLRRELGDRGCRRVADIFDVRVNVEWLAGTLWPDAFARETADA